MSRTTGTIIAAAMFATIRAALYLGVSQYWSNTPVRAQLSSKR